MTGDRPENPSNPSTWPREPEGYEGYERFFTTPIVRLNHFYTAGGDGKPLGPLGPLGPRWGYQPTSGSDRRGISGARMSEDPRHPRGPFRARTRGADCTGRLSTWEVA